MSVGKRLYLSILSVFLLLTLTFIVYQHHREREYRITFLDERLQDFNTQLAHTLGARPGEKSVGSFIRRNGMHGLRVTLLTPEGQVFYDSGRKDCRDIPNHSDRPEIREALAKGHGNIVVRKSATVRQSFFYSATFFPGPGYIVRSALPYDDELESILATDKNYLWFSLAAIALLTVVLYRFVRRLGINISKLRLFATRADNNEALDIQDLAEFPNDELGEIAERIIKVYKRYQRTRREQDELKRQLTHNIAHELKTPVASIQGYLETIINHPGLDTATREAFLSRCYAQSQRLTSLLRDISTLNTMDEVSAMREKTPVDISRIVEEIAQETALQFSQKRMRLACRVPPGIVVRGSRSLLYSVFRNLTDNALAYAGEGTEVVVTAKENPLTWSFTFYDTGKGVPAEHLPRLFERFYRIDKGRSRATGGTGLGLAIVKNAVLLHGGTIKAANRPEGGLRFDFTIGKS